MRKLMMVAALALLLPASASAQEYPIDRGSMLLGGSISFNSSGGDLYEWDGSRVNTLMLNPQLMYFVSPGLALGGEVLVQRTSQGDNSITSYGVGPAVSYYFGGPQSRAYPFVSAMVGYSSIDIGADDDVSGLALGGTAGVAYMLSRTVAATLGASYTLQKFEAGDVDVDGNVFSIDVGIQAFLF